MPEFINNITKLLGDDLKKELSKGGKLRIAASYFSIYAFEALKEELFKVDEIKFLFTSPTFVSEKVDESLVKARREFFIPKLNRERDVFGTEFEVRLKNRMTQRAIAKECAEWIRKKVKFKSNTSTSAIQGSITIADGGNAYYTPINGFTTADLGYQNNDSRLTNIVKLQGPEVAKSFVSDFDRLWQNGECVQDVTDAVADYIATCYRENAPEFVYFLILYNIFKEFLEDIYEDYMPNEATGFKNSLIWKKLYNFQRDGVIGIINKLEKYNGCILADSVGLGKTFTALAVMQYYSLRNKSILVLCPKRLSTNWNAYRGNTRTNIFYQDRIRYDVLFHTDLTRKSGESNGMNLATINWGNYDLVVIDESHNFRNATPQNDDRENRYTFLMNHIMKEGVKTKVLMLSATPVNNRYNDLKNQLALAYCGDFSVLDDQLDTEKSVASIFRSAQKAFNAWSKLPIKERKAQDLLNALDIDFTILLDSVTIARSRKHIQKYYDIRDIGPFPKRLPVKSYECALTDRADVIPYRDMYNKLLSMTMSVYGPLGVVFESRLAKYEHLYNLNLRSDDTAIRNLGRSLAGQINREGGIKRLMTINLMKRLESSVHAFRLTMKNLIETNNNTLEAIKRFQQGDTAAYVEKDYFEYAALDPDEDGGLDLKRVSAGRKIKVDLADVDVITWRRDIEHDIDILTELLREMEKVTVAEDSKLTRLKALIDEKIAHPFNEGNRKILIFSAFADTADYLYENLSTYVLEKYGMNSALIEGNHNKANVSGSKDTDRLLAMFAPIAKDTQNIYPEERQRIDLLIGTDCISEGQNLQDSDICINYDIHWNPVRIVQRFGRIDRIGSRNVSIQLVNFWPNISLDEYINLNKRVTARMTIVNAVATGDDNPINNDEELDFRKEQLKRLQDGDLQDLEDMDGSIVITDLGLNEFRMDMIECLKKYGEPMSAPKGLHAVVKADAEKGIDRGVIYVLLNRNEGVNINRQNRLHPYYLVYLKESGEVKFNHLEVKSVLDILRATCKNEEKPIDAVCRAFNRETDDGFKMKKYSKLLEKAVQSIIDVKEANDLDTLFNLGSDILFDDAIKGLDDFELIAFIAIK